MNAHQKSMERVISSLRSALKANDKPTILEAYDRAELLIDFNQVDEPTLQEYEALVDQCNDIIYQ